MRSGAKDARSEGGSQGRRPWARGEGHDDYFLDQNKDCGYGKKGT